MERARDHGLPMNQQCARARDLLLGYQYLAYEYYSNNTTITWYMVSTNKYVNISTAIYTQVHTRTHTTLQYCSISENVNTIYL